MKKSPVGVVPVAARGQAGARAAADRRKPAASHAGAAPAGQPDSPGRVDAPFPKSTPAEAKSATATTSKIGSARAGSAKAGPAKVKPAKARPARAKPPTTRSIGSGAAKSAVKPSKPGKKIAVRLLREDRRRLDRLKQRAAAAGRPCKRSELVRAGLRLLQDLDPQALLVALEALSAGDPSTASLLGVLNPAAAATRGRRRG